MILAGILIGFFAIQWLGLPRWRLFGTLVAVYLFFIGGDLIAMSSYRYLVEAPPFPVWWLDLGGGLLVGVAIGYFASWIRADWVKSDALQTSQAEQDPVDAPTTPESRAE